MYKKPVATIKKFLLFTVTDWTEHTATERVWRSGGFLGKILGRSK